MDEQNLLNIEMEEHTHADHDYKIHVDTVFTLARNMKEIFESSEKVEKRAFLNFLLQNPTVSAKKLEFDLQKPFNLILDLALHPIGLPERGTIISIFQDVEYMKGMYDKLLFMKAMRRGEI